MPQPTLYLYETWARPNMVTGAVVANTDDQTGAITNTATTAPEYYQSLEAMTADLRTAYEGAAAANPIFAGVAPVGAAFRGRRSERHGGPRPLRTRRRRRWQGRPVVG